MKIGDKVIAMKDCPSGFFKKGDIGTIVDHTDLFDWDVDFGNNTPDPADKDELKLYNGDDRRTFTNGDARRAFTIHNPGKNTPTQVTLTLEVLNDIADIQRYLNTLPPELKSYNSFTFEGNKYRVYKNAIKLVHNNKEYEIGEYYA
jgi:hypothetical protein